MVGTLQVKLPLESPATRWLAGAKVVKKQKRLGQNIQSMVSTLVRSLALPLARTMVTGPVALPQVRVKVEPGTTSNAEFVKAGVALTVAARMAKTEATENFILNVVVCVKGSEWLKKIKVVILSSETGVSSRKVAKA